MERGIPGENRSDLNWINKLEDWDSLSAEFLHDKNDVWDKLYGRLQRKPRRKRLAWYWLAAACLFGLIMLPRLKSTKIQDTVMTTKIPPKAGLPKPGIPRASIQKEGVVVAPGNATGEKKLQKGSKILLHNDKILVTRNEKETIARLNPIKPGPVSYNEDISPAILPAAAVTNTLTAAKPKTILKVVHINELGEPVTKPVNIVLTSDYTSFHIKLINPEAWPNGTSPVSPTGINIFKTRTAPSN